jgi:hypothetical protein
MFRIISDQVSLSEAVLGAKLLKLPDELARVGGVLDDPVFVTLFEPFFDPLVRRSSTPDADLAGGDLIIDVPEVALPGGL